MSEISCRNLRQNEIEQARRLILKGLEEHFGYIDDTLNPDLDSIQESYLDRDFPFLVAVKNGRIIATGALVRVNTTTGQIVRVSVAAGERRQGIARRLVGRLIQEAKKRGYLRVVVETCQDWHDATALYLNCGFRVMYRDQHDVYLCYSLQ